MFPSWDEAALRSVVEANGDDREATISQLLSWTDDDAGAAATAQDADEQRDFDRKWGLGGGDAALAGALAAAALEAPREPPPVLRRDFYDDVMAKRLAATIPPEATGAFLRAVSKFKSLAKHAHEKAPREHRPSFVLRAAESQRIASNFHLHYRSPSAGETPRRLFLSYVSPIHYNVVAPSR
ncbi:hypothetical protein JL720_8573 [Aureococcus anophagefferens]|nr:hypothetical protein JL720_8573 [Aureococcus anophagefferens]